MSVEYSPNFIEEEKKRLESENQEATDTEILQLLIDTYGGVNVAKYLTWKAELTLSNQ